MTSPTKIPLKQAEISVRRFNDTAVPHHLGLLKNHRSNIEKSIALGDWNKVKKEEINAMRVIKQIKNLLMEMNTLREKVRNEDLERFDAMMDVGKQKAFDGMKEFLELQMKSPSSNSRNSHRRQSNSSDDDSNISDQPTDIGNTMAHQRTVPEIEADFEAQQYQLQQRQSCLEEMELLQNEIQDLNGMFRNMNELVHTQAESVQAIADNAEEALEQVLEGERNLRRALTYKTAMYPIVGALLGTCVGGPIGLVAGLKVGSLAAVGCGILGFTGGSVLESNSAIMHGNVDEERQQQEEQQQQQTDNIEMEKKQE